MQSVVNVAYLGWDPADSYGRKALELARGLEARGYHVNKFGGDAPNGMVRPCFGGIHMGYPTRYAEYPAMMQERPKLAITAWESTIIPEGWADVLNGFDAVSVGSQFTRNVFLENGIDVPIHVHPLGVSEAFTQGDIIRRMKHDDKPITFLTIADRGSRKGGEEAIRAFITAFGQDTRYKLIVKCRDGHFLGKIRFDNPNIEILAKDLSDAEMAELYRRCDVMIFASKGEGFGLPPREFAATGGIALATNWGGLADDIHSWGFLINGYWLSRAWDEKPQWHGKMGVWAQVDIDALAKNLQNVVEHHEMYAHLAYHKAGWVRENYTWSRFAENVADVWEGILNGDAICQPENAIAE